MKKALLILFVFVVLPALLFAEGKKEKKIEQKETFKDGIYFATQEDFSEETGWKSVVTLEVKDAKIISAEWNGAHKDNGHNKDYRSRNGMYPMVEQGGAQAPWHEQAEKVEAYLIEHQDPDAIKYDKDGYTDAISGVSIHVNDFFAVAAKALQKGPVGYGAYKDGTFHAEAEEFSHGWKPFVDVTVISGYIVAAEFNSYPEEGEKNKIQASKDGDYGMVEQGGAQALWWEQIEKSEAYLLETQDPTEIQYKDEEGHTDAISGVSIHVKEFFTLAQEALKKR